MTNIEKTTNSIKSRLLKVQEQIAKSALLVRRNPDEIKLIVVTKKQPIAVVEAAILAGAKDLGENYPEDAVNKIKRFQDCRELNWHMIGHLQSRKTSLVLDHFNYLHSLDRPKLAEKLERMLAEINRTFPVLLEFNVGGEKSKYGWNADDVSKWENLFPEIEQLMTLEHLDIRGLMTMPPYDVDPEKSRPYFQKLARLQDCLRSRFPKYNWNELSMGTSVDFEVAIQEGATMVRIGQAILGPRD